MESREEKVMRNLKTISVAKSMVMPRNTIKEKMRISADFQKAMKAAGLSKNFETLDKESLNKLVPLANVSRTANVMRSLKNKDYAFDGERIDELEEISYRKKKTSLRLQLKV